MFWTAFDVGSPDGPYKAPYAVIFREMAILGVEGFSELPKYCMEMCGGFFAAALAINLIRDVTPKKYSQYIPIPMAMAVPFYIGGFGSSLIAMDQRTYELIGLDYPGNRAEDVKIQAWDG
ncbi:putative metal-nicotianamine transporter YSL6-like [Trifolium medium]|uniref:Putative metal-nicotianamine transporter YSL6-like n=1 Tax=Trifolium medium TaxID=97028 RepID=A0A392QDA8_9FABA|nr:putative metal-nicotianamine transporter YSL6-like [Trifolium medium]